MKPKTHYFKGKYDQKSGVEGPLLTPRALRLTRTTFWTYFVILEMIGYPQYKKINKLTHFKAKDLLRQKKICPNMGIFSHFGNNWAFSVQKNFGPIGPSEIFFISII